MKRDELPIPEPCRESFDGMRVLPTKQRYCEKCDHSVIDVSAMTEAQARRFLARVQAGGVCVSYLVDPEGQIDFRRVATARSLAAPALLGLSLVAAACSHPENRVAGFTNMQPERRVASMARGASDAGAPPASSNAPALASASASAEPSGSALAPHVASPVASAARQPTLMRLAGKPMASPEDHAACDTPTPPPSAKPPER